MGLRRSAIMTGFPFPTMRELDSRESDGRHVRLLWSEPDGRITVTLLDHKSGESLAVEVDDPTRAMDVFRHPHAYLELATRPVAVATA
jgi:hypothetical protein